LPHATLPGELHTFSGGYLRWSTLTQSTLANASRSAFVLTSRFAPLRANATRNADRETALEGLCEEFAGLPETSLKPGKVDRRRISL